MRLIQQIHKHWLYDEYAVKETWVAQEDVGQKRDTALMVLGDKFLHGINGNNNDNLPFRRKKNEYVFATKRKFR
jgi:hypothetical protein